MIRTGVYLNFDEMDRIHARAPRWRAVRILVQSIAASRRLWVVWRGPYDVTRRGELLATRRLEEIP